MRKEKKKGKDLQHPVAGVMIGEFPQYWVL